MNSSPPMSGAQIQRNRITLMLVIALFVVPILVAQLYVNGVFDWHPRGLTNRGTLITPPIDVAQLPGSAETALLTQLAPSHWAIVAVYDGACDKPCGAVLDRLLVIRELLAQGSERVTVFALANQGAVLEHQQRTLTNTVLVESLKQKLSGHSLKLPAILFLDWRHQIMMHFNSDAPPEDIQHDLKRVLRASAIR